MRYVLACLVFCVLVLVGCQVAPAPAPAAEAIATEEMVPSEEKTTSEEMAPTAEITSTATMTETEGMTSTGAMPTDPVEVVTAFFAALNAHEYEKAVAFLADDGVMINEDGTYTGPEANLTQLAATWDAGIRVELSSLVSIDGIVGYHVIVTENGTLVFEGEGGITIVEDGKITFDGDTSNMPPFEEPTSPIAVVTAFYVAMNSQEFEKAVTYLADDAVMINPTGTYTGTEANLAQIKAAWDAGIRVGISSLRNVDGIVVYYVDVTENGTPLFEGEGGITIVEDGKITFDGDTSNMPPFEDPTAPIAVVTAFYIALNAKEYDKAMTFVADDATLTDDTGTHTGKAEIAARIKEAGDEGRSYDIWDVREEDGTVSYNASVYQGDTVSYDFTGSDVVEDGKITMTSTAEQ